MFLDRFSYRGVEASPSRDRKQKQRLLLGHPAHNPPPFQQYSSGSVSPNRVAASTNTEQHSMTVMSDRKESSRAIPMPSPPTSQSSRARNSVEGFNTEIEKLVMRGNETPSNKVTLVHHRVGGCFFKWFVFLWLIEDDGTDAGWASSSYRWIV